MMMVRTVRRAVFAIMTVLDAIVFAMMDGNTNHVPMVVMGNDS
jgi:hypothetical protein